MVRSDECPSGLRRVFVVSDALRPRNSEHGVERSAERRADESVDRSAGGSAKRNSEWSTERSSGCCGLRTAESIEARAELQAWRRTSGAPRARRREEFCDLCLVDGIEARPGLQAWRRAERREPDGERSAHAFSSSSILPMGCSIFPSQGVQNSTKLLIEATKLL